MHSTDPLRRAFLTALIVGLCGTSCWAERLFAYPYLQRLTTDSAVIAWVSDSDTPRTLKLGSDTYQSEARPAPELEYNPEEQREFSQPEYLVPRYLHQVRIDGLQAGRRYRYAVELERPFQAEFVSPKTGRTSYRFVAYSDSETEPESVGKPTSWPSSDDPKRVYLTDQDTGYRANLQLIRERQPQAVIIAGDLVESGGEQRDWDEFWRHNTNPDGAKSLASQIPILPAIGNHDSYGGPRNGKYERPAVKAARDKYFTYFQPTVPGQPREYHSVRLGPARLIFLDSCDGTPHKSAQDSNFHMEAAPALVPDFNPGSPQYLWLEKELAQAQKEDAFTFVVFHHCPYSSGPHAYPPGHGQGEDPQSGQPLLIWTPLFLRYGVDAAITGHDEIWERSTVEGEEVLPNGKKRAHILHVYDVGIGGDGLRRPETDNPFRKFAADTGAPELWKDGVLVSGGRHYGHLEVNLEPVGRKGWKATLDPVYLFPIKDGDGWKFERRLYPDTIVLLGR